MLDRGLRRRFDPAVERAARDGRGAPAARRRRARAATSPRSRPSRSTRRPRATSTTRSPPSGSTTARSASGSTSPTSPPTCRPARSSTARRAAAAPASTCPARSSRCCRRRSRTSPARCVPGQDRLAVTVELEFEGAKVRRSAFTRSTIRSDARLDYPRVDRIFAGEERAEAPWAEPLAAAREAAAALEAARQARGALAVETVEPEFDFSHEGHVDRPGRERDDRVAPADRAPDDRRQRGGRDAAGHRQGARALPHPRAPGAAAGQAPGRAARLARRADPAAAGDDVAAAGRGRGGGDLAHGRRPRAAHRPRPRGADLARAALAQAGALRPGQHGPRRPALAALLPLHLADPPLPRPRLPPRAALGGRRRRGRARGVERSRSSPTGAPSASATRCRSSAPPTTSRAASCSRRSCSSAAGRPSGRAR